MLYCHNCGAQNPNDAVVCGECGVRLDESEPVQGAPAKSDYYYQQPAPSYYQQPASSQPVNVYNVQSDRIPPEYEPLSAWAYFGYSLLFAIPLVGFILLIVFAVSSGNINRRNYARSYFCGLIILLIFAVIFGVIVLVTGGAVLSYFNN